MSVIGLPGDHISLRARQIFVNTEPLREGNYAQYTRPYGRDHFGPVIVPKQGDRVEIRQDQRLYLNGEVVPIPPGTYYPYERGRALTGFEVFYAPLFPPGTTLQHPVEPMIVEDNYYFTLGDNRDNSKDSRYWGFVPRANIVGVAKRLYWSWDRHAKRVRWERIGRDIQ